MTAGSAGELSVVIPVFNVSGYLPEFLASLDAQGDDLPRDLVFVDDGSTDYSAALIDTWIATGHGEARLIRTENRGVSAARNTGMDAVRGEWMLFLDPDDVLAPDYFAALHRFLAEHTDVDLAATNLLRLQEPDRALRNTHQLRFRFAGGTRVAELGDDVFVMNAASVAFPVSAVRASGSRFRTGLHASEDSLFVVEYLLSLGRTPRAGFVADAKYGYRKRAARDSAVDRYRSDPTTYTVRFHEGYATLLEAAARNGGVPDWLQSIVLYEMQWLLPVQFDPQRYAANLDDAQRAETLAGLKACLRHVSDERLLHYDASALPLESRMLILALTDRELWPGAFATMPRGWRKTTDIITYSTSPGAEVTAEASIEHLISWAPDIFGQRVLFAHRLRAGARVRKLFGRDIVWPLPGESLAQTQDRHRRRLAGFRDAYIPAQEGEVYVRRTRPWAPDSRSIRREIRRRGLWSKDAMIGRLLRPARDILVEHQKESAERSADLFASLSRLTPTQQVNAKGGPSVSGALRFGSLAHRLARARSRMLVSAEPTGRPSPRARLRGLRAVTLDGFLDVADALAVRRFTPDLLVTTDAANVARLGAVGIPAEDVLVVAEGTSAAIAAALVARAHADERLTPRKDASLD